MPTTVTICVFKGNHTEIVPEMCMFCGQPLAEDKFAKVPVQIGNQGATHLALPICSKDRLIANYTTPDGRNHILDHLATVANVLEQGSQGIVGVGLATYLSRGRETVATTFTFDNVHRRFAAELDRLRQLTPAEYDQLMAKLNARFVAKLHDHSNETDAERARRLEREQERAGAEESFTLQNAKRVGDVSQEVSRDSSMKFLIATGIVAVISVLLLICMSAGVIGYIYWTDPTEPVVVDKKDVKKPKEHPAKIKQVEPDQQLIKFLVPVGRMPVHKEYKFSDDTKFFDKAGGPMKLEDLKLDEYCVVQPTDDGRGLKWLKLTDPPP